MKHTRLFAFATLISFFLTAPAFANVIYNDAAIFNATLALYSAYAKDHELQNWSAVLKTQGIL